MSRCIITGCGLSIPDDHRFLYGDMHEIPNSGILIFNAVLGPDGEAREDAAGVGSKRTFYLTFRDRLYEKRGILVFPENDGTWSSAAQAHLAEWRNRA